MTETGGLSRKKKVRAAHRASVTRTIDQVQEMLSSGESLNEAKLKQKKQALQSKTELLNKLDEEIAEIVPEDGLDEEVEQADAVRERIKLAIIDLNGALDGTGTKSRRRSPTHSESDERERSEEPPANPLIHDDDESHNPHMDGSHRTSRETTPTDSRAATPSGAPTDLGAREMMHSPRVKLPKLSLKRFNGDLTKWTTFWDTFKSAVHDNSTLTSIDKFNYLNSLLESAAAEAIAGLTLTSANYEEAIATLKRRFGNKQLIVNCHMDLLLNLEGVTSQHNLKGQVAARECSVAAPFTQPKKLLGRSPPTALSLMASASAQVTCMYCDRPHSSNSCQTVTDLEERKRLLRASGRCFVCLR